MSPFFWNVRIKHSSNLSMVVSWWYTLSLKSSSYLMKCPDFQTWADILSSPATFLLGSFLRRAPNSSSESSPFLMLSSLPNKFLHGWLWVIKSSQWVLKNVPSIFEVFYFDLQLSVCLNVGLPGVDFIQCFPHISCC